MSNAFMLVGAEPPVTQPARPWWQPLAASAVGGALGAVLWRKHPILAALLGMAAGRNAFGVYVKDREWTTGLRRVGEQCVAIAGSLALPKHPVVGYVAGAVAGEVFIDGKGGGLLEQWVASVKSTPKSDSTALVTTKQG